MKTAVIPYRPASDAQQGFTVVELMVSVFVAALFAISLIGLFTTFNYFMATGRQESVADNYTYNLLQQYTSPNYTAASWFTCDDGIGAANTNDRTVNPLASGSVLDSGQPDGDSVGLPVPVSYSIVAVAPYGCADTNDSQPILVTAKVTYGKDSRVITHSAYAEGL